MGLLYMALQTVLYPATNLSVGDGVASTTSQIKPTEILTPSITPTVIKDSADSAGSAGQYLASDGAALTWTALPSAPPTPTLSEVLVAGNSADATNIDMNLNQIQNVGILIAVDALAPATLTQVQVSSDQITVIPSPPGALDEYDIMTLQSAQLRFQHQVGITATTALTLTPTALSLETDFNIAIGNSSALTLNSTQGTAAQVITADANGTPYWAAVPVPNLADVLGVVTAGDAGQQTISNLLSVAVENTASASSIVLSQTAGGQLDFTSSTAADLLDTTLSTKQFSGNYLKLSVGGVEYFFQAFSEVPP